MTTSYARVFDGIVREIFTMPPSWQNIPITQLFAPGAGTWVDVTALDPQPAYGWLYDGSKFSEPPSEDATEARREWAQRLRKG